MENNGPTVEQQQRLQLKEYRQEYWQQYYLKNKEIILERNKERQRARYANNKELAIAWQKAYYKRYADKLRTERMEYYWNVEKDRTKKPKKHKKFEPSLVTYELNVTLTFD